MIQNAFQSSIMINNPCNNNLSGHVHSCPYCRCRSLDNSNIINFTGYCGKMQAKVSNNHSGFMDRGSMHNRIQFSKLDQKVQNVYYRSFDSPNRQGFSPKGSRKIVIQYSSPQPKVQNSIINQFFKPPPNSIIKAPVVVSSPIKTIARTIYTDENTPPKSKYLQKMSSRKNSEEIAQYATPFQSLALIQSDKIKESYIQNSPDFFAPFTPLHNDFKNEQHKIEGKQMQNVLSSIKRIDFLEQIPHTSAKHLIHRVSSPQSSGSPFNSLIQTTPQIMPYGSFSSTPIIPNDNSQKKKLISSINQITQFIDEAPEVKLSKKASEPVSHLKYQLTPKQIQLTPKDSKFNYQRYDRTLGKFNSGQRVAENQLVYSESDQRTLQNYGGSQRNIFDNESLKINSNETRSQQNIRSTSGPNNFQKKKNKFDIVEISDNLETPKSKYKTIKEENKLNQSKNSIKFNMVRDHRKSKISVNSKQSRKQSDEVLKTDLKSHVDILLESAPNSSIQKAQLSELSKSKSCLNQDSKIKPKKMINSEYQPTHMMEDLQQQSRSSVENGYITELTEQLKLNYDYYLYQPTQVLHVHSDKRQLKIKSPKFARKNKFQKNKPKFNSHSNDVYEFIREGDYAIANSSNSYNQEIDITF